MKQKTWPSKSDGPHFTALPFIKKQHNPHHHHQNDIKTFKSYKTTPKQILYSQSSPKPKPKPPLPTSSNHHQHRGDFSALPYDVLARIAATFTLPNLQAASLVCRAWRDALQPLREAMLFLRWGKKFKHGRGGVKPNLGKALDSFLKGVVRGSTLAMVDAGLVYWEMGRREEAIALYEKAALLGDPTAQCNLGIAFLQGDSPKPKEAVKWLYQASIAGHVRAQYQIALCSHKGRGMGRNLQEAEGDMMNAVVYLELAGRAGETAAVHVKDVILQQMSVTSRDRVLLLADSWRPLPSSR